VWSLSTQEAVQRYDGRGALEGELHSDKGSLPLARRRQRRRLAQEALILLTDLAPNNIAWLRPWIFADSPFAEWGPRRIIRDLFAIPGDVVIKDGQLVKVRLSRAHPYAAAMAGCLAKLLEKFETLVSWRKIRGFSIMGSPILCANVG
jgi:DDE family transposase